ncbi:MAG: hypothetical protein AAF548_17965 [Actinomycetota bacterium]
MQERTEHEPDDEPTPESDEMLDGFESDLDDVTAALDALDADDLDGAERLTAGLDDGSDDGVPSPDDAPAAGDAPAPVD